MALYLARMAFCIVVIALCSARGLQREHPEEDDQGRGRLHQLCKSILNGDDPLKTDGLPKHDRIRHHRQKSKCKYHIKAEERCRKKYSPVNGTVQSFHDNFYGWVVKVRCDKGFSLQGRSTIICYEELDKNERPFCKIKDCGDPAVKRNTTFRYSSTTYSSQLYVECDKGLNYTRSPNSKCMASGKWSPIARCVHKDCPAIKSPAFGRYHETTTNNHGSVHSFMFECAPGYELVGSKQIFCHYGVWSSPEPRCMGKPDERTENRGLTIALSVCITMSMMFIIMVAFYLRRRARNPLDNDTDIPDKPINGADHVLRRARNPLDNDTDIPDKPINGADHVLRRARNPLDNDTDIPDKPINGADHVLRRARNPLDNDTDIPDKPINGADHVLRRARVPLPFNDIPDIHIPAIHIPDIPNDIPANDIPDTPANDIDNSNTHSSILISQHVHVSSTIDMGLARTSGHMVCSEQVPKSQLPTCLVTPLKTGDDDSRTGTELEYPNQLNDGIERGQDRTDTAIQLGFPNQLNDDIAEVQDGTETTIQPGFPNRNNGIDRGQDGTKTGQEVTDLSRKEGVPAEALRLNWNKLFFYLVPKVCTDNWKLFAINLLGTQLPLGQSAGTTLSQIENRSKTQPGGEKIEYILLNVLWHWKKLKKNAQLIDIENALDWSHHQDVIHDLKNEVGTFYEHVVEPENSLTIDNKSLNGIPELEYRALRNESAIMAFPLFEEPAERIGSLPASPFTEELMTCNYGFNETSGFHFQQGRRFYKAKRQYSYPPFNRLRYKCKFPKRAKFPPRRPTKAKAKAKEEISNRSKTFPRDVSIYFTEKDMMCADLINRILDLDSSKKLNSLEYRMLTKYVLYKVHKSPFSNIDLYDLLEITFEGFTMCDHVSTPQNGTLHLLNSCEIRIILTDAEWELLERYALRARNDAIERTPEIEHRYLFLTYDGQQVTTEYLNANIGGTPEPSVVKEQAQQTEDQTVTVATDNNRGGPNAAQAQKTGAKFDFKRMIPVSRRSNFDRCAKKRQTDSVIHFQHGRRFFCEKQTTTIEAVFKDEIHQGFVKESEIRNRFLNCTVLREAFGVNPNEVTKILVKKVTDRVRCFIRKRKA